LSYPGDMTWTAGSFFGRTPGVGPMNPSDVTQ
jgi:hypothetical protein